MRSVITCLLAVSLYSSCAMIMGVKHTRTLSDHSIMQYARKYDIDRFNIYKLDTAYSQVINQFKASHDSDLAHDLVQPLQYMLFDHNGKLLAYNVNCDMEVSGLTLNWNTGGCFNFFPPKSYATLSPKITFQGLHPYFIPINKAKDDKGTTYTCVVLWNRFLGRQSKALITAALKNLGEYTSDHTVALYFVNDDNFFAKQ